MNKEKKRSLVFLSIFSIAVIVLGVFSIKNSLNRPFYIDQNILKKYSSENNNSCSSGNCSVNDTEASNLNLKLVDTDGDKISDWDELFVYGTSPYLEDTDGDGLSDYEEIFVYKTNPLCPEGQDCYNNSNNSDYLTDNNTLDPSYDLLLQLDNYNEKDLPNVSTDDLPDYLKPQQVDAQYLRDLLAKEGFSQESLDQLSDQDLLDIYQEAFNNF